MIIIHNIDDFFLELFPSATVNGEVDEEKLKVLLSDYYEYGGYKPAISIKGNQVVIEINIPKISENDTDYRKIITLCEKGKFSEAKPLLKELIKKNPTNSEYYRILGQIHSDEGNQTEAINQLIDALCWDPKNKWALIMMGNIFARHQNDVETAMKYYDQAVLVDPSNNIALNNIGAVLMENQKYKEAKKYFDKAISINTAYPNTHYALAVLAEKENDLVTAFEKGCDTLKLVDSKNTMYKYALEIVTNVSRRLIENEKINDIVKSYIQRLENQSGKKVLQIQDDSIPTVAKLEVAENYNRQEHIIKFKSNRPGYQHLIMHELVHLDFITQARKTGNNSLFTSTQHHKQGFIRSLEKDLLRLSKEGIPEESLARFAEELFSGINRQIFNTPIDLFIEDFLFQNYKELRPFQFISLYIMNQEGKEAVTNPKVVDLSPKGVLSTSKIYNLVNAIHFKNLYGVDFVTQMKGSPFELKQAEKFIAEYQDYSKDKEPAEEYELVQNWANDLKVSGYFELVDESKYRNQRLDPLELLNEIEKDPFDINTQNPLREKELEIFLKNHEDQDINMAVVMYMVSALEKYQNASISELQKVAVEIAMLGTQGISPDKKGYKIAAIPNVEFSGYHLLAFYYVTWKLFNPEMHKMLQLPFDKEYELAKTLVKR
ncbi:hypothetical protein DR864_12880 [Runella rosea]|uniref:Uncharacterized protein n=1 Tax=Runella rosea TaxID=2259595 RepID=A0A344TIW6_9BACT|nr:tetratricopeptide repeat protein [Runella rosea]AXE18587.1 hypothetical protein DR864_12880 [Runella rosea]